MEQGAIHTQTRADSNYGFGASADIFLVDDDLKSLEATAAVLSSQTGSVLKFQDPSQAFEAYHCAASKPRLLILDYSMPGLNGVELMVKCRQIFADVRVIMLSGALENEALDRYPFKVDAFFEKPIHPREFLKTVAQLLE